MRKLFSDFGPGQTQTRLYSHRIWLEAGNIGSRNKRDSTLLAAKNKGADQLRVYLSADLRLCFSHTKGRFSHDTAILKRYYEPRREKTGFLHMRKQRRRSPSQ